MKLELKNITLEMFINYCAQATVVDENGISFNGATNFNEVNGSDYKLSKNDKSALKDAAIEVVMKNGEVEAVNKLTELTAVIKELGDLGDLGDKTVIQRLHELSLAKKNMNALKDGMTLIVNTYNAAISHKMNGDGEERDANKAEKRGHFVDAMAAKLKFDIKEPVALVPLATGANKAAIDKHAADLKTFNEKTAEIKAFKAQMGKAFDSMHVYYGGKEVPAGEKDNPSIAKDKTYYEAFKAALLMIAKIILAIPTLGATFWNESLSEKLTSSRSAKTSFADSKIEEQAFVKSDGEAAGFATTKKATFAAIEKAKKEGPAVEQAI